MRTDESIDRLQELQSEQIEVIRSLTRSINQGTTKTNRDSETLTAVDARPVQHTIHRNQNETVQSSSPVSSRSNDIDMEKPCSVIKEEYLNNKTVWYHHFYPNDVTTER